MHAESIHVTPISPRLLDVGGAATYLSLSTWTIRDLIQAGHLQPVRLPVAIAGTARTMRRIRLCVRELDAFIDRCKADAAPTPTPAIVRKVGRPRGSKPK